MNEVTLNGRSIKYEVVIRPVKYVRIYVLPEGILRIVAPRKNVENVLRLKSDWILKRLEEIEKHKRNANIGFPVFGKFYKVEEGKRTEIAGNTIFVSTFKNLERFLKKELRNKVGKIIDERTTKIGKTPKKIFIRKHKNKWGSCSSKGNLALNLALVALPDELIDYVVTHELAHLIELNHSKDFWRVVEKFHPDYKEKRKELRKWWIIVNNNEYWKKLMGGV